MSTNIQTLKQLIQLEEKRASLTQQLSGLDSQAAALLRQLGGTKEVAKALDEVTSGSSEATQSAPARKATTGRRKGGSKAQRGGLSDRILGELKNAGAKGIHVKDLAERLDAPRGNIGVWFSTTGKKNKSIKKVAPATFRLV